MISVVIPAYNVEKYIRECLESVVNQTYTDLEIIVIDDGSTDRTLDVIRDIANSDKRITVYEQKNMGAGAARNFGLEKAKGEYIIFLDADDYFEADMLEAAYKRITENNADICVYKSWEFDDITKEEHIIDYSIIENYIPDTDVFNWQTNGRYIFNFCNGWPWDKLYRKAFIDERRLRFQEIRTSNDTFFVLSTLAYAEKICTIRVPYVHHRINNKASLSFTREKSWDCCFKAAKAVFSDFCKLDYYDAIKQSLYECMDAYLYWHFTHIADNYRERVYNGIKDIISQYGIPEEPREDYNVPFYIDFFQKVKDFSYSEYMLYEKITGDMNFRIDNMQRDIMNHMQQNEQLRQQNERLRQQVENLIREKDALAVSADNECKKICSSLTYRIGNGILFIPKKIANCIFKTHY